MRKIKLLIMAILFLLGAIVFYPPFIILHWIFQAINSFGERDFDEIMETSNRIWVLLRTKAIAMDAVEDHPRYPGQAVKRWKKGMQSL